MKPVIEVKIMNEFAIVPRYQTAGSAGMDIHAAIEDDVVIYPGRWSLIPTGISVNITDSGIVAILASRSGLMLKSGVRVGQGIGVIDSDYQQQIGVILHNDGVEEFTVHRGDRIAQLLFMPVFQVNAMVVDQFSHKTERRGGFGSTGV